MAEHDDIGADDAPDLEPTGVVVDHRILDAIYNAIQQEQLSISYMVCNVTRESECLEFTDKSTGRRFEIVVRAIEQE